MNTPNINDYISSLLNDRHDDSSPTIPDGTVDLSHVITPLRTLSLHGRAMNSDEDYAIAQMLGRLLDAYIPNNPTPNELSDCILGLTILITRMLRTVPALIPEMSMEEFLIDPSDQDDLIALGRIMAATPLVTTPEGLTRPNIAQLPIFYDATRVTEEQIEGFAKRHITPYEDIEWADGYDTVIELVEPENVPTGLNDTISDPYNGFEDFFEAYFENDED